MIFITYMVKSEKDNREEKLLMVWVNIETGSSQNGYHIVLIKMAGLR